jgi:hypothetical protein
MGRDGRGVSLCARGGEEVWVWVSRFDLMRRRWRRSFGRVVGNGDGMRRGVE